MNLFCGQSETVIFSRLLNRAFRAALEAGVKPNISHKSFNVNLNCAHAPPPKDKKRVKDYKTPNQMSIKLEVVVLKAICKDQIKLHLTLTFIAKYMFTKHWSEIKVHYCSFTILKSRRNFAFLFCCCPDCLFVSI